MLFLSLLRADRFYGFRLYHQQRGQEREYYPAFCQPVYAAAVPAGRHFLFHRSFPGLAPAHICEILPLKQLNDDAMRNVAFEGAHLTDCWKQLGILTIWGIGTYAVAIKVFKWE
jgi:ABC-2 type transport system permease protein